MFDFSKHFARNIAAKRQKLKKKSDNFFLHAHIPNPPPNFLDDFKVSWGPESCLIQNTILA